MDTKSENQALFPVAGLRTFLPILCLSLLPFKLKMLHQEKGNQYENIAQVIFFFSICVTMWSRALSVPGGFQCTWAVSEIKSGIHRATIRIPDPLGCWQQGRSPKEQSHAVPRGESASLAILPSWGQSQAWPSALQTHPAPEKGLWHLPTQSHQHHDKEKAQQHQKGTQSLQPFHFHCVPATCSALRGGMMDWEKGWWYSPGLTPL